MALARRPKQFCGSTIIVLDSDDESDTFAQTSDLSRTEPAKSDNKSTSDFTKHASSSQEPAGSNETDNQALFQKLLKSFENFTSKDKDGKAVLSILRKRYHKATVTYRNSAEFRELLHSTSTKIATDHSKIFVYIKELVGELKAYQDTKVEASKARPSRLPSDERAATGSAIAGTGEAAPPAVGTGEAAPPAIPTAMEVDGYGELGGDVDSAAQSTSAAALGADAVADSVVANAEETSTKKSGSRRQIAKLEKMLEKYSRAICEYEEKDMDMDDLLSSASSYVIVGKLKARASKIFWRLCDLKGRDRSTGRPLEKKFKYSGTRYPEINRKIQRFINKRRSWEERMPDYHDIHGIVVNCNTRFNLSFSKSRILEVSKEAFTEVGNLLQQRRQDDFVSTFGSHITDSFRPSDDPALYDKELKGQLDANKEVGRSRLDEVINKYAYLERDQLDSESTKGQSQTLPLSKTDSDNVGNGGSTSRHSSFSCDDGDDSVDGGSGSRPSGCVSKEDTATEDAPGAAMTSPAKDSSPLDAASNLASSDAGAMILPVDVVSSLDSPDAVSLALPLGNASSLVSSEVSIGCQDTNTLTEPECSASDLSS